MALAALGSKNSLARILESYQSGFRVVESELKLPFHKPQGGAFVFLDLRHHSKSMDDLLWELLEEHIALAPGAVFGQGFESFARLCYTTIPPEALATALGTVNRILA